MRIRSMPAMLLLMVLSAGCRDTAAPPKAETAIAPADSAYAIAAQLTRFQATAGPRADTLVGAMPSLDALVKAYLAALDTGDTAALRRMQLDRNEFAWIYYAESPMAKPPYELDPDLMWMQIDEQSRRGASRALASLKGQGIVLEGLHCDEHPVALVTLTLHQRCLVSYHTKRSSTSVSRALFSGVIVQGTRYKFLGYANDF